MNITIKPKSPTRILITLIILCSAVLFTSCTEQLQGEAFFDINQDGYKNGNETGAPLVEVTVSRDGKPIARGLTLPDGTFSAGLKKKEGRICVQFNTAQLGERLQMLGIQEAPTAAPKSVSLHSFKDHFKASAADTGEPQKTTEKTDGDSKDEEADTGQTGDSGSTADSGEDDEGEDEEEPEETASGGSSSDSSDDEEVVEAQFTPEGYCFDIKKKGTKTKIPDIKAGLIFDVKDAIDKEPDRQVVRCYYGETCNVKIYYPLGLPNQPCTLIAPHPPEHMLFAPIPTIPQQGEIQEEEEMEEVVLTDDEEDFDFEDDSGDIPIAGAPVATQIKASATAPSISATTDINVQDFYFIVDENAKLEEEETKVEFQASIDCGITVPLKSVPIIIVKEVPTLDIVMNRTKISSTKTRVDILMQNPGTMPVKNVNLTVELSGGIKFASSDCLDQGDTKILCKFDEVMPSANPEVISSEIIMFMPDMFEHEIIAKVTFDGTTEEKAPQIPSIKLVSCENPDDCPGGIGSDAQQDDLPDDPPVDPGGENPDPGSD